MLQKMNRERRPETTDPADQGIYIDRHLWMPDDVTPIGKRINNTFRAEPRGDRFRTMLDSQGHASYFAIFDVRHPEDARSVQVIRKDSGGVTFGLRTKPSIFDQLLRSGILEKSGSSYTYDFTLGFPDMYIFDVKVKAGYFPEAKSGNDILATFLIRRNLGAKLFASAFPAWRDLMG